MEELSGSVYEIVYRSEESNYTVLELASDDELITCVGQIPAVVVGEFVTVKGEYTTHRLYGEQFSISHIESTLPATGDDMCVFLGSGIIKGVGPVTAGRIVKEFGDDSFNIIDNHPQKLAKVKGISIKLALKISNQFKELNEVRDTVVQLEKLGLSLAQSMSAFEMFGKNAPTVVLENPYKLTELAGFGFGKADTLARELGMEKYTELRNSYGTEHILKLALEEGHTCYPREKLALKSCEFLCIDKESAEQNIDKLIKLGRFRIRHYNNIPAVSLYYANESEVSSGSKLMVLCSATPRMNVDMEVAREVLDAGNLSPEQEDSVYIALNNTVSVITGGPGTGKTTILNELISIFELSGLTTDLAAPTGRAAKRMEMTTGRKAQTIHRLLEFGIGEGSMEKGGKFGKNEDNPLECDVLIADEMSMVDVFLLKALLDALRPGTRVVFTGDKDQLPSVGAGNVLGDMIISNALPVTRLTKIFRQTGSIALVAHDVNAGRVPEPTDEFFFHPAKSAQETLFITKKLYTRQTDEVQVICPVKKGVIGVINLNSELRDLVNPVKNSALDLEIGERVFRKGDRVMQTANNYAKEWRDSDITQGVGVFNGDMGIVSDINKVARTLDVLFDGNRLATYTANELVQIEHAYAVTVHKAQGSEFDSIILPLYYHPNNFLTRNLLYTAMTRAKHSLHIVGMHLTFASMISNNLISKRFTGLNYEILSEQKRLTEGATNVTDFSSMLGRIVKDS